MFLLGQFTSDVTEKEFSKLRQGSGGAYFLTVKLWKKFALSKLRFCLNQKQIDTESVVSSHQCSACAYKLSVEDSEIFDDLAELEEFIPDDAKMSLVHIAGYVTRNNGDADESELLGNTTFYFTRHGQFSRSLERGGLKVPTDVACQWTFFCFVIFQAVKNDVCRKSLSNIFSLVNEF